MRFFPGFDYEEAKLKRTWGSNVNLKKKSIFTLLMILAFLCTTHAASDYAPLSALITTF